MLSFFRHSRTPWPNTKAIDILGPWDRGRHPSTPHLLIYWAHEMYRCPALSKDASSNKKGRWFGPQNGLQWAEM